MESGCPIQKMAAKAAKAWRPYSGAHMECPWMRWFPESADPAWEAVWAVRWRLLSPLHRRIPRTNWTIGETFFLPVVLGFCVLAATGWQDYEGSSMGADLAGGLAFATAMKNSAFTLLLGLPFERALFYHKTFGLMTLALGCYHGYVAMCYEKHPSITINQWTWEQFQEGNNWSGLWLLSSFALICATAFWLIRRHLFEVFQRGHMLAVAFIAACAVVHGATLVILGVAAYGVDLLLWALVAFGRLHRAGSAQATAMRLPADVIRISFPRGDFKYRGGQYCFVCVKALGPQFHPFSFSSSPHDDTVTVHIRVLGDWTKRLYDLVARLEEKAEGAEPGLEIFFDGPYGAPAVDVDRYQFFVLVSGGIGITPMQSLWCELLEQHARGRPLKSMQFLWTVADKFMLGSVGEPVVAAARERLQRGRAAGRPHQLAFDEGRYARSVRDAGFLPCAFQPPINPLSQAARILGRQQPPPEIRSEASDSTAPTDSATPGGAAEVAVAAEFYLTRVRGEGEFAEAGIDPATQAHVVLGRRPDFQRTLLEAAARAREAGERSVAVLACGPTPMVEAVRRACGEASGDGVCVDFHSEVFEF